jgi:hypothetical protein
MAVDGAIDGAVVSVAIGLFADRAVGVVVVANIALQRADVSMAGGFAD